MTESKGTARRIVLLGPPASGKGTQGARLVEALEIPKIATGDMLRAATAEGTALGKVAADHMSRGQLVPDGVVIGLVKERLSKPDARQGFILDGFPRTVPQADSLDRMLDELGTPVQRALLIEVPRRLLMERAVLRRIDKKTGQIYHLKYNPPPLGADLEHRADDREETVENRLNQYESITADLAAYYADRGTLSRIDGVGTPDEVEARIQRELERWAEHEFT